MKIEIIKGQNLKRLRLNAGLTQKQIGEYTNDTEGNISAMESGKRSLTDRKIDILCEILNVSPYEFLIEENTPLLKDAKELELLETYREIKNLDPVVAEEIIKYEKYRLKVSEEETDCPTPRKSKTA